MKEIDNFNFLLNVSREHYETKEDARACLSMPGAKAVGRSKMAFMERRITVSEFLELATSGHSFCNLFQFNPDQQYWVQDSKGQMNKIWPIYRRGPNQGYMNIQMKCDKFFRGAQVVFVDVDFTCYTDVREYLARLTLFPTCAYMSYSDKKMKKVKGGGEVLSRRFRMVYVFEEILDKKAFITISRLINDYIVYDTGEPMDDDCGTRMSQYMNGVYGNDEKYSNNVIYSISDFIDGGQFEEAPQFDDIQATDEQVEQTEMFNKQMIKDMEEEDYETFMHYYCHKKLKVGNKELRLTYFYRTELENWEEWVHQDRRIHYQYTNEDYLRLYYNRETLFDGQHRRRKLFEAACLRRLMRPDVDANTLLFNLYIDRERFYDNSDGVITITHLMRKVLRVLEMSTEELLRYCSKAIAYWKANRPTIIFESGINYNMGVLQSLRKELNYREIDEQYDPSMSVKENVEAGLEVSLSTLYRYCEDRGYDTDPDRPLSVRKQRAAKKSDKERMIRLFIELYNYNLSPKDNMDAMAEKGLILKYTTFMSWRDKYIPKQIDYTPIDIPKLNFAVGQFNDENEIINNHPLSSQTEFHDLTNPLVNISWPLIGT